MSTIRSSVCAGLLTLSLPGVASALLVDWLVLQSEGSPNAFALLDDDGIVRANGALSVTSGFALPGLPASFLLASENFTSATGLTDTLLGDESVRAMEFRVAPPGAEQSVVYSVSFTVPAGRAFGVAVGGLLRDSDTRATAAVMPNAEGGISLLGMHGWDDGEFNRFTGALTWVPHVPALEVPTANRGDSQLAFILVEAVSDFPQTISLSVPIGYNNGLGDAVIVGLGMVIPEPKTYALIFGLAALGVFIVRRRVTSRL